MSTPNADPREVFEAYADETHRHGTHFAICTLLEHHEVEAGPGDPICLHDRQRYPCATVRAIHDALTAQPPSAGPLGAIPRRSA